MKMRNATLVLALAAVWGISAPAAAQEQSDTEASRSGIVRAQCRIYGRAQ